MYKAFYKGSVILRAPRSHRSSKEYSYSDNVKLQEKVIDLAQEVSVLKEKNNEKK